MSKPNTMLQKLKMLATLIVIIVASSCVSKKKLQAAQAEVDQLKSQVAQLTKNNNDLQKQLADLTASNKAMMTEYNSYKDNCQAAQAKLQAVQAYLHDEYNTLQALEKKIEDALVDFKDKGVEVYYKNGLVYVRMEDNLLYKSGSAALGDKGKTALSSLASVLNDYPKLKVIVLGNTDDVQFKKGSDNWSLSTERANGVVRILRDDYKVEPSRLTAAGKGKYSPVADNSTAEGRAKNRRTDIILNPDLDKLWESVQ